MSVAIYHGDALSQLKCIPGGSVDCCVTSPPYWALRDYGVEGQIGLERTPELWCSKLVEVFREVRRTLKQTGTLWLNLGDCYISNSHGSAPTHDPKYPRGRDRSNERLCSGNRQPSSAIKSKDLVGQPWMLAFALRADGWYLRRDIVWHKPNAMPESVRDRPTTAHEYVFLLSKSEVYYYDQVASMEPTTGNAHSRGRGFGPKAVGGWDTGPGDHSVIEFNSKRKRVNGPGKSSRMLRDRDPRHDSPAAVRSKQNRSFSAAVAGIVSQRNSRSVWSIPTAPYRDAHFATFPARLAERCIVAGSSERGCCLLCGAPWEREAVKIETEGPGSGNLARKYRGEHGGANSAGRGHQGFAIPWNPGVSNTVSWRPSCACTIANAQTTPAVVLDPFAGAATTLLVAERLGRDAIGIELNPEYIVMAEARLTRERELREPKNRKKCV